VVTIRSNSQSIGEREAILIVSGFGSKMFGNREQEKYASSAESVDDLVL